MIYYILEKSNSEFKEQEESLKRDILKKEKEYERVKEVYRQECMISEQNNQSNLNKGISVCIAENGFDEERKQSCIDGLYSLFSGKTGYEFVSDCIEAKVSNFN